MKATWEKTEENKGILTVEVDEQKVEQALDQAFKKIVRKVNVPGFRKGKVPRKIFENRFGVETLYQDALDILLPEAYGQAVNETGIEPVDRPEVDVEQMEKGLPLIFKATVTVKPEVQLGQYKGLEIEAKDFTVTEEDIEEELKRMQERQAELVVVEDGAVENNDYAIIDFQGFIDGQPFEGGEASNYNLLIGSGSFIPGFEEQLIGMKKGEEKEIEVTFPQDYHNADLAGKKAVFKVKVNDIKRKNLPAIDDEFVKDVSEFDTLAELKEDIKKKLEEKNKIEEENYKKDAVVRLASENATINIPDVMIEHEIDHMVKDFAGRLQMQGLNLELYFQFTGLNEDGLREQFKEEAEKRVRSSLTLEAIAKAEGIEATDAEVDEEIASLAIMYKRNEEEIRKIFMAQDNLQGIKEQIKLRKTVEFLVENSKIKA